jgi:hypothetical protein
LQEAASDYQRHKSAYKIKRSQLEGHLDNFSRTSLNMLEASLWRLEAQTRPKTVREAVIDTITRTVASGMDPRAIDLSWLDQARTVGIETTTLTGDQLAFIKRLETAGNFVRRENGRILIVGLSDTDLGDIRGVQQLLASPNSDAARELRDAFIKLARAWALADAMAAIYGKQLQDVLASRETGVEGRPPESPPADEPADAGRGQTQGARTDAPRTDVAPGATQRHVGLIPTAAASDQSGEAQLARLSRQRDEAERQDHQRTDDQRQAALDQQTARRLAAEAAASEKRAVRAAEDQRHP